MSYHCILLTCGYTSYKSSCRHFNTMGMSFTFDGKLQLPLTRRQLWYICHVSCTRSVWRIFPGGMSGTHCALLTALNRPYKELFMEGIWVLVSAKKAFHWSPWDTFEQQNFTRNDFELATEVTMAPCSKNLQFQCIRVAKDDAVQQYTDVSNSKLNKLNSKLKNCTMDTLTQRVLSLLS